MADNQYVNKVIYAGETLIDLTQDTVEENNLLQGVQAHNASGRAITGTFGDYVSTQQDQGLTEEEKQNARNNIEVPDKDIAQIKSLSGTNLIIQDTIEAPMLLNGWVKNDINFVGLLPEGYLVHTVRANYEILENNSVKFTCNITPPQSSVEQTFYAAIRFDRLRLFIEGEKIATSIKFVDTNLTVENRSVFDLSLTYSPNGNTNWREIIYDSIDGSTTGFIDKLNTVLKAIVSYIQMPQNGVFQLRYRVKGYDLTGKYFTVEDPMFERVPEGADESEYPHPFVPYNGYDVVSCGRNLFNFSLIPTKTNRSVTCTNNGDGSFTFSGTFDRSDAFSVIKIYSHKESLKLIKPGKYIISCGDRLRPYTYFTLHYNGAGVGVNTFSVHPMIEVTKEIMAYPDFNIVFGFYCEKNQGDTFTNRTVYPMLEYIPNGADENQYPHTFEPYKSTTVHVTNDIKPPLALKSYSEVTNILSPSNVEVSYALNEAGGNVLQIATKESGGITEVTAEDVSVDDTKGVVVTAGNQTDMQSLIDAIADKVMNQLLVKSQVVNNLLATVAGNPLDAVQGKALDDKITAVNNDLSNILTTASSTATISVLRNKNKRVTFQYPTITGYKVVDVIGLKSSNQTLYCHTYWTANNSIEAEYQNIGLWDVENGVIIAVFLMIKNQY